MKRQSLIYAFIIFIITAFLLSSNAWALMVGISTEDLTRRSDAVVTGVVESVESFWSEDGRTIYTRAVVLVRDLVRKRDDHVMQDANRVIIEYEGGEVGGIGLKVSDAASFTKGENVLLFLKELPEKAGAGALSGQAKSSAAGPVNAYRIVGMGQGKYSISNDGIATKSGFTALKGADVVDNNISIEELTSRIRGVK